MSVFIGLGGNVGDHAAIVARFDAALCALGRWPEASEVAAARVYETEPVGPVAEQPVFLNTVAEVVLSAALAPTAILGRLLALERSLGRDRDRERAQGPRALDLDLLLAGDAIVPAPGDASIARDARGPSLVLPHPRLASRAFALRPLADLVGAAYVLPHTGRTIASHLAEPAVAAQRVAVTSWVLRGATAGECSPGAEPR